MGEPDYGHTWRTRIGHWASLWRAHVEPTNRPFRQLHQHCDVAQYHCASYLSTIRPHCTAVLWRGIAGATWAACNLIFKYNDLQCICFLSGKLTGFPLQQSIFNCNIQLYIIHYSVIWVWSLYSYMKIQKTVIMNSLSNFQGHHFMCL